MYACPRLVVSSGDNCVFEKKKKKKKKKKSRIKLAFRLPSINCGVQLVCIYLSPPLEAQVWAAPKDDEKDGAEEHGDSATI